MRINRTRTELITLFKISKNHIFKERLKNLTATKDKLFSMESD